MMLKQRRNTVLKRLVSLLVMGLFLSWISTISMRDVHAGPFGRAISKSLAKKSAQRSAAKSAQQKASHQAYKKNTMMRDKARDSATPTKPLNNSKTVRRYTSKKQAEAEMRGGVQSGSHMTSKIPKGRPISGKTAKERYGLENNPEVRMTVRVPKGHPVRHNKVIGGKPGYGEVTSNKAIPKEAITDYKVLKH